MKQMKGSHEATHIFHRPRRDASSIPVRLMSLLACAALVVVAPYSRADDTPEQNIGGSDNQHFGGADHQNELPGPTKHITVEMHQGTNMAAVPSPDGTKMVLSLQGGLWIIPASGGTATKITPWDVESTQPAWSPDGEWIAFQNYSTAANYAIWVVKSDGSQLHAVTSGPFDDREPSWYPDSSKVIFSSDRSNDKQYKIWSVTLGGALQQLTTGTGESIEGYPYIGGVGFAEEIGILAPVGVHARNMDRGGLKPVFDRVICPLRTVRASLKA